MHYLISIALVTTCPLSATLEVIDNQVRDLCRFSSNQYFTLKWIDEEQDPCMISCDMELKEAFRIYEANKESQLTILVIDGVPDGPGMLCPKENPKMYRHGAKRWKKKFYLLLGHQFAVRRFNRNAICAYCNERIWGLGQQGFRCINCRLLLHRRCQGRVAHNCGESLVDRLKPTTPTDKRPLSIQPITDGPSLIDQNGQHVGVGHVPPQPRLVSEIIPREPKPKFLPKVYTEQPITELPDIPITTETVGLHNFNLIKVIGRGSYAKVFQVEHKPTKRIYAMKVIKKETILDDEDIEWVQTEKHVFECATNHPFLVGLHSCFQTRSRLFFVIEFVNGGDLMYHMQRNLRLAEDYARFYSAEICIALNFLHERGIIYRDLKLDNILMDSEGHIKLTDYGMCKEGITGDLTTSTFCGTPNYIAPEILSGQNYSYSVDWWALGVLMFEMLAGRSPWDGVGQSTNPDQNTEDFLFRVILTRPIRFPRSISVRATNILNGFLKKIPTERLGCKPDSSFADIMNHPFFANIDWIALEQKQYQPPYKPAFMDERDLVHFDPVFTDEPVQLTPDNNELLERIDQTEFEGFEYVNPLLMTIDEQV